MLNYAVLQTVSLARGQKRRWLPKHQHQSDLLPELMQQLSCYVMTSAAIQLIKPNAGKMFFRCSLFFSLALTGFLLKEKDVPKAPLLTRGAMVQMVLALPYICNGELSKLVTLDRKKVGLDILFNLEKDVVNFPNRQNISSDTFKMESLLASLLQ